MSCLRKPCDSKLPSFSNAPHFDEPFNNKRCVTSKRKILNTFSYISAGENSFIFSIFSFFGSCLWSCNLKWTQFPFDTFLAGHHSFTNFKNNNFCFVVAVTWRFSFLLSLATNEINYNLRMFSLFMIFFSFPSRAGLCVECLKF